MSAKLPALLTTGEAMKLLRVSLSAFNDRRKADPSFPKAIRFSPRRNLYDAAELAAWIDSRRTPVAR